MINTLRVFGLVCMLSTGIFSAAATDVSFRNFIPLSIEQFYDAQYAYNSVSVTGVVEDVIADETDSAHIFFLLTDGEESVLAPLRGGKQEYERWRKIVGARVLAIGTMDPYVRWGGRWLQGPTLSLHPPSDGLTILEPPGNLFDVPLLTLPKGENSLLRPSDIVRMGRRRTCGRVIARIGRSALLKSEDGHLSRIDFAEGDLPSLDASVEVVGFPETDLYRINFTRSIWRTVPEIKVSRDEPELVTARFIMHGTNSHDVVQHRYHGRSVRLRGRLAGLLPVSGRAILLEDGGEVVTVEMCEAFPMDIEPGSLIEVTGVCLMDIADWTLHNLFPQIRGFSIAVAGPESIRVIARPPWWTPSRLMLVIGALLAFCFGVIAWNVSLRKLAARKGRELLCEQIDRLTAELKTEERTRLAVELHDSLAQNLTGVAFEIDTANKLSAVDADGMKRHLVTAALALKSCQAELRDCLWDLRHRALEAADMDSAIRQTLAGHLQGAEVTVRFNVPRERLSDNTAHVILRIVRELTINAVRHGGAGQIRVAGCLEDGKLFFSVSDDGKGFDVENAPGFDKGHYGLVGIQERIETYEGRFMIESVIGKGTKATVVLNMPQEGKE